MCRANVIWYPSSLVPGVTPKIVCPIAKSPRCIGEFVVAPRAECSFDVGRGWRHDEGRQDVAARGHAFAMVGDERPDADSA